MLLFLLLIAFLALIGWAYFSTRKLVTVRINESQISLWTAQATVRNALVEAAITWNPEDVIQPPLEAPIPQDGRITIRLAAPVLIQADGVTVSRLTQSSTVAGVLKENGIELKPSDRLFLDDLLVEANAILPRYAGTAGRPAAPASSTKPARIQIERAVPVAVNDNGLPVTIFTTERTLGSALEHSGFLVYLGDEITPDLGSPVTAGSSVFIRRSRAASIQVDGRLIKTRTRLGNVGDLLAQEGVHLDGKDYTDPTPTSPVLDGTQVKVTRVREVFVTETIPLTFEVRWLPNPDMEIDTRAVPQQGDRGIKNRLFKQVYENGKLISRGLVREWIAKPPQDRIINYGTKVVVRDLTLPDGRVVQYWRDIRMLATSYTAATSGKPRNHPEYGITYLGLTAGKGIVAVDPRVVNLRSTVYVPGYGLGLVGDTGGVILGHHIDLGFAETDLELWYEWTHVYLLTPVPPAKQINFILPDYPRERPREQ